MYSGPQDGSTDENQPVDQQQGAHSDDPPESKSTATVDMGRGNGNIHYVSPRKYNISNTSCSSSHTLLTEAICASDLGSTLPPHLCQYIAEFGLDDRGLSTLKVGSEVQFGPQKGRVRFIGNTFFSKDEPVVGIELEKWSPNANDGSIEGKRYFDVEHGKGFFLTKQSYMNLVDMMNASLFYPGEPQYGGSTQYGKPAIMALKMDEIDPFGMERRDPPEYQIGERVRLKNGETGIVSFVSFFIEIFRR